MTDSIRVLTEEPTPLPEDPPPDGPRLPPGQWAKENLFNSWYNAVLTVVFAALLAWVAYRAGRFVFVTGRWEIIQQNLTNFMVGRFPRGQLARLWVALGIGALVAGLGLGISARQREATSIHWATSLRRAAPGLLGVAVLLSFTRTPLPIGLTAAVGAVGVVGRLLGARLPLGSHKRLPWLYLAGIASVYAAITAFGGVGWDAWGGILLTLFVAGAGIVIAFPFGLLLALGRRSSFPVVRTVCVAYIELIRGVPLYTLLLIGATVIGLFLPPGSGRLSLVTRALIAIVLFSAAYVAEIVRGGLQSVPRGQTEAAQAIGLSPLKLTFMIVLPQALRNVIPALVGQFISLFKDTSLLVVLSLLEILGVAQAITQQPDFLGQGLQAEALTFVSFLYWVACYSMSRASQRLEMKLGVGTR